MSIPQPFATFARLEDDTHLTEMRSVTVPEWNSMVAAILLLQGRAKYLQQHGDSFAQAVLRGERDGVIFAVPAAP